MRLNSNKIVRMYLARSGTSTPSISSSARHSGNSFCMPDT